MSSPGAAGAPLGLPRLAVLDEVEGLDGAEAAQQLPALLVGQVVRQAAHEHAVLRIRAAAHAARLHVPICWLQAGAQGENADVAIAQQQQNQLSSDKVLMAVFAFDKRILRS